MELFSFKSAYKTVLHSYGLDSNPSSDDDDDLEVMDPHEQESRSKNQMSDMMTNLYNNKPSNRPPISNDSDPIDISSEDSDDEEPTAPATSTAVQSTQRSQSNTPVDTTRPQIPKLPNGNDVTITLKKIPRDQDEPQPTVQQQVSKKRRFDEIQPSSGLTPTQSTTGISSSKQKKYKKEVAPKKSTVTFADIGGMDRTLKQLCELLMHIKHPEIYQHIGLPPPRGFLLHGPPGSGKTLLAHCIAGQLNIPLIEVPATELIAGVSGESEERIRDIFEQAGE